IAPISAAMKTLTLARLTDVRSSPPRFVWIRLTLLMEAEKRRNAARDVEAIAWPFVRAFVVLPTASRRSVISRAPASARLNSAMAPALAVIGANASLARMYAGVHR